MRRRGARDFRLRGEGGDAVDSGRCRNTGKPCHATARLRRPHPRVLDPVRFLSNRSTSQMGFAVAAAGVAAVHEVALVAGPVRSAPDRDQERHLARLNDLLRGFCEEAGIAFVDALAALSAAFPDGVEEALDPDTDNHLRYAGMEAVAAAVRRALAARR